MPDPPPPSGGSHDPPPAQASFPLALLLIFTFGNFCFMCTHPHIPNTVTVLVSENTLAPIVVHVLCFLHHSSGLVLYLGCGQFLHHFLMPYSILGELKVL